MHKLGLLGVKIRGSSDIAIYSNILNVELNFGRTFVKLFVVSGEREIPLNCRKHMKLEYISGFQESWIDQFRKLKQNLAI